MTLFYQTATLTKIPSGDCQPRMRYVSSNGGGHHQSRLSHQPNCPATWASRKVTIEVLRAVRFLRSGTWSKLQQHTPFIIRSEVGGVSCILVLDHARWLGPKQITRNIYLRADEKRCMNVEKMNAQLTKLGHQERQRLKTKRGCRRCEGLRRRGAGGGGRGAPRDGESGSDVPIRIQGLHSQSQQPIN